MTTTMSGRLALLADVRYCAYEINNVLNTWQNLQPFCNGLENNPECMKYSRLPPRLQQLILRSCQTFWKTPCI